jgi:hypothetical protein
LEEHPIVLRKYARPLPALLVTLGLFNAAPALADQSGDLGVGVCKADITPVSPGLAAAYEAAFGGPAVVNHSDPIFLAGFGNNRQATGYNDRLWARGVVVKSHGVRVALVALDVVGYFLNEVEVIRAMVSPASEIDYVVVSSTHQHEGPDTLGIWGPDEVTTGIDYAYLDFVNAAVADCIDGAAASLRQARLFVTTTDSVGLSLGIDPEDDGLGVGDGKVLAGDDALAPATEGRIVDPTLATLQFTTREHPFDVLATLVNFASHPESLGSNNTLITSDFPHYVRERLEARYGGVAVWISGDLGVLQGPLDIDVLDPATGLPAVRRTFRWADVHGTQLAERAITAIDAMRFKMVPGEDGKLIPLPREGDPAPKIAFSSVSPVAIRLDNPFFRFFIGIGVLDVRRMLFTNGAPDDSVGFPYPPPFDGIPQALGEDIQSEVGAIQIGKAGIAVVPTELDPQIGFDYRAQLEAKGASDTFIIGLGNDEIGYQLPAEKFDESCFVCAPFILGGVPQLCPAFPPDCNTVFQNNVGERVDPEVSAAMEAAIDALP